MKRSFMQNIQDLLEAELKYNYEKNKNRKKNNRMTVAGDSEFWGTPASMKESTPFELQGLVR